MTNASKTATQNEHLLVMVEKAADALVELIRAAEAEGQTALAAAAGKLYQEALELRPEPWVLHAFREFQGKRYELLRRGREWMMTGAHTEHRLHDSGEERAMAHWNGYGVR